MIDRELQKAVLRLFKCYVAETEKATEINSKALEKGIVIFNPVSDEILQDCIELYGIKDEWQNTFHKSFGTVVDTPIEKLVAQQIIHYFSTYGLESLGLADSSLVYIPHEELDIPEFEGSVKLAVIKAITETELTEKLMTLITSGIALARLTINDVMLLSDYIDKTRLDDIANREIKLALYDKFNLVPKNNEEFLKYLVYKITGYTFIIKNNDMIHSIREADGNLIYKYLKVYIDMCGNYDELAKIFRQYKVIILNLKRKGNKELNYIINKIRRRANIMHQACEPNILDRVTSIYDYDNLDGVLKFYWNNKVSIERDEMLCNLSKNTITETQLLKLLSKVTIFREVRILNALRFKTSDVTYTGVYKIRNGKTYVDEVSVISENRQKALVKLKEIVQEHLQDRFKTKLAGKTIYYPWNSTYMVPTTEKQFVGDIPVNSSVVLPRNKNIIVGIHWNNGVTRVDLDLHTYSKEKHYGWNSAYKEGSNIVYSGDVTDAPKEMGGATECYWISHTAKKQEFLIKVKNFTANSFDVPMEFIVASSDDTKLTKNYTINPNDIIAKFNIAMEYDKSKNNKSNKNKNDKPDMDIAYIEIEEDKIIISFVKYSTSKSNASADTGLIADVMDYSAKCKETQLTLQEVFNWSDTVICDKPTVTKMKEIKEVNADGEEIISYKAIEVPVDIDLSFENISKDTLIKLMM